MSSDAAAAAAVPTEMIGWWEHGEEALATAVGRLVDEDFPAPSLLPGWTRAHVIAHVVRNADAIGNLLTWARTGVETPMYPSQEARDRGIEETARRSPDELRGDVVAAAAQLAGTVRDLPAQAWAATVRTNRGREVTGADVIWMRCWEVWVHAVDLDSGVGFADLPGEVLAGVVDEVFLAWATRDETPDLVVFAGDREWGSGSLAVAGSLPEVAEWLTGRGDGAGLKADGPLPQLPRWL